MRNFLHRLSALTLKEIRQIFRDPSSIMIGLVLPIALILIFGYGLSLDVKNVPIAIVMEKSTPLVREVLSGLNGSLYFSPRYASSMHEAEKLLRERKVDAILRTPSDFDSKYMGRQAEVQLILHGVDSTTATLIGQYVNTVLALNIQASIDRAGKRPIPAHRMGSASIQSRIWFNESADSTWYLVPGLIVIIMTLVGAFLTALVMAREWERGTLEALFVSPAGRMEILLAKIIPYFFLGMAGLLLCLAAARWLFFVPLRGSMAAFLLSSALYLFTALGMGLAISSVTRNQFLSCQIALVVSFLPAVILSGFIFDLRSVPLAARIVGNILPATYFMEILKTLFLAGNNSSVLFRDCAALLGYTVLFMGIAIRFTRKTLD